VKLGFFQDGNQNNERKKKNTVRGEKRGQGYKPQRKNKTRPWGKGQQKQGEDRPREKMNVPSGGR